MHHERGFTLLEVLVASIIAAAVLSVLLQTAMTGNSTVREAGRYETAMALARSHLALLGGNVATLPPEQHGHDGPFDWQVQVTREAAACPGPGVVNQFLYRDAARAGLFAVDVQVSWQSAGHRRQVQIETKRLGFAPPASTQP